jgi:hypothetical protein
VVALVIGGGTLAFQPLMRQRIESRLSELLGADVKVGSSRISLVDGIITLRDVVVRRGNAGESDSSEAGKPTTALTHIEQVALKFDWDAAAYRNLSIQNLLAEGVRWKLATPSNLDIPIAHSSSVQPVWTRILSEPDLSFASLSVEKTLQPIQRRLSQESARHSSTHDDIDRRLQSIQTRIHDAMPSGSNPNPLRQRTSIDELKRELAIVRQSVAEDRLRRKEADKAIAQLKSETQSTLESQLALHSESEQSNLQELAMGIAKAAVARNWNAYRPIVHSALQSMHHLPCPGGVSSDSPRDVVLSEETENAKMPSVSIPPRFTKISAARIRGNVDIQNATSLGRSASMAFELRLKTPSYGFANSVRFPSIAFNFASTDKSSFQEVICNVDQVSDTPSGTRQTQVCIEQKKETGNIASARILQSNHGWSSTLVLPIEECLKEIEIDHSLANLGSGSTPAQKQVRAKLVGTTPRSEGQLSEIEIEVERSSLTPVETMLATLCEKQRAAHQTQQAARGNELLQLELAKLARDWDSSGEKHVEEHRVWDKQISQLNEQIQSFESFDLRTSRQSTLLK